MATEGHRYFGICLAALILAGCHREHAIDYPTFAEAAPAHVPTPNSGNAFDSYVLAATRLETEAAPSLDRVAFSPGQRREALKDSATAVSEIARAIARPCDFKFVPRDPFSSAPYLKSWRLIGRCLYWRIQDACAAKDFKAATSDVLTATTFGFDLTGGSCIDAALGLQIVDDARRALAPSLDQLSAADLKRLEAGVKAAMARRPILTQTLTNERANCRMAIQAIETEARAGNLAPLQQIYGAGASEPLKYLETLKGEDAKIIGFVSGLAAYTDTMFEYTLKMAQKPEFQRDWKHLPPQPTEHAWRRLVKYVAGAEIPLLSLNDATVARTRLFVIQAELFRRQAVHMPLPTDLNGFSPPLAQDPYSNGMFIYRSNGQDGWVYSVGKDGLDNGGQTDTSYTQPDLTLERPML